MERTKLIQQIYKRLASLEEERATTDIRSERYAEIDVEMTHLRLKLQDAMNSVCPLVKGVI